MGSEELADNIFRIAQTDAKLKRDNVDNEYTANSVHFEVGKKVRNTIKELGFENENQYNEQILKEADIKKIKQEIEQYKEKVTTIKTRLEDIKKEIKEKVSEEEPRQEGKIKKKKNKK